MMITFSNVPKRLWAEIPVAIACDSVWRITMAQFDVVLTL